MEALILKGSVDTPSITLDVENNIFEFSGRSLPENASEFYNPILNWIEEYAQKPLAKTVFEFKLTYFNTASSKLLLDIFTKLEEMTEAGKDVLIKWYYPEDDEDMDEAGDEYADMIEVPFEKISYVLQKFRVQ